MEWATTALDRLRLLDLACDEAGTLKPVYVPLDEPARKVLEAFAQEMQARQEDAGGLLRSTLGKARGLALRLSLVLAFLRWCAKGDGSPPPAELGEADLLAACGMVESYSVPMAERVFGDAAATEIERNAATLARWVHRQKPDEVHVRTMVRQVRLPGLHDAAAVHGAAAVLVEADWLRPPPRSTQAGRAKVAYAVNPALRERPR